jgi:hypothetical protein
MRKTGIIELAIIISTLVIVLILAFAGQSSYAGSQTIDWNNASRALTFDLQKGQSVNGWVDYTGEKHGAWFLIGDPDGNEIGSRTSEGDRGTFMFTATIDGQYFIDIGFDKPFTTFIDYSYSISAPSILGVNRTVLTGIVITVGVVLVLAIAVWDLRRTRQKRKTSQSDKQANFSQGIKI